MTTKQKKDFMEKEKKENSSVKEAFKKRIVS
jgi:hypothetical protein